VEYTPGDTDLGGLKKEIEGALHDRLLFGPYVELVPEGTLPRYEMKAKLIRKLYEEK
jgi:phenylacetate-CoA ligase